MIKNLSIVNFSIIIYTFWFHLLIIIFIFHVKIKYNHYIFIDFINYYNIIIYL
jgi:hypothetical protein